MSLDNNWLLKTLSSVLMGLGLVGCQPSIITLGDIPESAQLCSGVVVNGVVGVADCSGGSEGSNNFSSDSGLSLDPLAPAAGAEHILLGRKAYNDQGVEIEGSITLSDPTVSAMETGDEQDDAVTELTVDPAAGGLLEQVIINLGAEFTRGNICSGKTIFGRLGQAACMGDIEYSYRDKGDSETRLIPVLAKDDDGYNSNNVDKVVNSTLDACGMTQHTVEARLAHCAQVNGTAATWDGAEESNSGHGVWKLVSKTRDGAVGKEVWRDERTGLLWSDHLGNLHTTGNPASGAQGGATSRTLFGWCYASGNTEDDGNLDCQINVVSSHNYVGVSLCAEEPGLFTPDAAHSSNTGADSITVWTETNDANNSPAILDAKGGMKLAPTGTSPSVTWRLPSREDYTQAYVNGMGFVLPRFSNLFFWTSTARSNVTSDAFYFRFINTDPRQVTVSSRTRSTPQEVRCVGQ